MLLGSEMVYSMTVLGMLVYFVFMWLKMQRNRCSRRMKALEMASRRRFTALCAEQEDLQKILMLFYTRQLFEGAKGGPYIVFTLTRSVRNIRNNVNIYIYVSQQHGGLLGGSRYHGNISVSFVSLLLFSSVKNLLV